MGSRPARPAVAAVALACLVVAASGGAAAHATALFGSRELAVDAGGSVEVPVVFHNVDSAEFRLEGPDGFRLTGTLRNGGGVRATLALDTAAVGRGDAGAALGASGGRVTGVAVEGASGALPAGEYDVSLVVREVTVDRGTLTVRAPATTGGATDASVDAGTAPARTGTPGTTAPPATGAPGTGAAASTAGSTTAGGSGVGPVAGVASLAAVAVAAWVAVRAQ